MALKRLPRALIMEMYQEHIRAHKEHLHKLQLTHSYTQQHIVLAVALSSDVHCYCDIDRNLYYMLM